MEGTIGDDTVSTHWGQLDQYLDKAGRIQDTDLLDRRSDTRRQTSGSLWVTSHPKRLFARPEFLS